MTGFAHPEFLAAPQWLAGELRRADLRVLDVRWRADGSADALHQAGHVPGAAWIDWRLLLARHDASGDLTLAADPDRIAEHLGRVGIGDATEVILYDDTLGLNAARAWWTLRAIGHHAARVLDGGWAAWTAGGLPVEAGPSQVHRATLVPRPVSGTWLAAPEVAALAGSGGALLLDARGPAGFHGSEGMGRLGHIPGAANVPAAGLHVPGTGRLRDTAELRAMLAKAGATGSRRVVCYDASGVGATRLAHVLAMFGHEDAAVLDGGWQAWTADPDRPVDR